MDPESRSDGHSSLVEEEISRLDSVSAICALANARASQGQWDDAIKAYQAAIALEAANSDLYNRLAKMYEAIGNLEGAEETYKKSIALNPSNTRAYYNLGALYEKQQRIQDAIQAYEQCLPFEAREKLTLLAPERNFVLDTYDTIFALGVLSVLGSIASTFLGALSGWFDPIWGIIVLAVAILAWKVKLPAMLLLYGVLFASLAVRNSLSGLILLIGSQLEIGVLALSFTSLLASLVPALLSIFTLKEFRKCRRLSLQELYGSGIWPSKMDAPQDEAVVTGRWAIAGTTLAIIALLLLITPFLVGYVLWMTTPGWSPSRILVWLNMGSMDIAMLALGLSCAALLSENSKKGWAIVGVMVSALAATGYLGLMLLNSLVGSTTLG